MAGIADGPLTISALTQAYERSTWTLQDTLALLDNRLVQTAGLNIWITPPTHEQLAQRVSVLEYRRRAGEILPLYGVPFAVKDNIDVEGLPTTAACPDFAYTPKRSAFVVELLLKAGALLVGKTNLDQFATGLVGTRSPYGACKNPFDDRYISGGSSSGSAVAVATGLASFALGTDTAGSGRVPAAFNNIVGLKPTRGLLSTCGVVPACASLDCVSVFTLTVADAQTLLNLLDVQDVNDPFQRTHSSRRTATDVSRIGVPASEFLRFFGQSDRSRLFDSAIQALKKLGKQIVPIDFSVFQQVAAMLYDGPWVAERQLVAQELMEKRPDALLPVIRDVFQSGSALTAADAFRAMHQLQALRHRAAQIFSNIDALMVPTAGGIYRQDEIAADPLGCNTQLGYYTNFTNLLDLAAVAIPAGFDSGGLPFGVSFIAPALMDDRLLALAAVFHPAVNKTIGAYGGHLSEITNSITRTTMTSAVQVAVVGAHLRGQPLNHELLKLDATFIRQTQTAPDYRLYALTGTRPAKPGLIRVSEGGVSIEVEIWQMNPESFGRFVAAIPQPLGIGTVKLADGGMVKCFLCESIAMMDAEDISESGGWRNYLGRKNLVQF